MSKYQYTTPRACYITKVKMHMPEERTMMEGGGAAHAVKRQACVSFRWVTHESDEVLPSRQRTAIRRRSGVSASIKSRRIKRANNNRIVKADQKMSLNASRRKVIRTRDHTVLEQEKELRWVFCVLCFIEGRPCTVVVYALFVPFLLRSKTQSQWVLFGLLRPHLAHGGLWKPKKHGNKCN